MISENTRILLVNDHIDFLGGGDAAFALERRALERRGYQVFTFSHAAQKPANLNKKDFLHIEPKWQPLQKVGKFTFSPAASKSFRDVLVKTRPHLVHLHLITKYPLAIYRELLPYATVQTLHGPNLFCSTGWGCIKHTGDDCELGIGTKCLVRGCVSTVQFPLLYSLNQRMLPLAKKAVDCFLCPSRQLLKSAQALGFAPAKYLPSGVDHEFCTPPSVPVDTFPSVLFVGALSPQKGPNILLEAFIQLKRRTPDAVLRFAGRGCLQPCLKERAQEAGVLKDVEFLGFLERPELRRHYQKAQVLAVPSIWKEQWGLIGPEALACGTPCVGSNIGGIPEWLHDGKWGFLVPPRDSGALADKLYGLLVDQSLRSVFAERGRTFVLEHFDPARYEDSLVEIIGQYRLEPSS